MNEQVLVVGAGPVGLTMAAELARYGVKLRIIDKSPAPSDKSKALVVWSRTLELMDRMGCSGEFVSTGLKVHALNIVAGGKTIGHVQLDKTDTPYPFALMIPQNETERLLEKHLSSLGVRVERQGELLTLSQTGRGVRATIKTADGREEEAEFSWLIGCDGGHSAVRHGLDIKFEGDTRAIDFALADLELEGGPIRPDEATFYWHADGALGLFPMGKGKYRVVADMGEARGEADRADPTVDEIQAILDRRGGGGIRAHSPQWLASFRINERMVKEYRRGRVFLAGDAAHVHSPAGGQGMNTGIQDACNLAWKLAMVVHGRASEEPLLGSYSAERSAVGRQVLKDASRLTTVTVMKGGVAQAIRNHLAALLFGLTPLSEKMAEKLEELSISYPNSPLTRRSAKSHAPYVPGQRAPVEQPPIGAGDTPLFAVLAASSDAQGSRLLERYDHVLEPQVRAKAGSEQIVLVRPDGYIAMTAGAENLAAVEGYLEEIGVPAQS